MKLKKTKEKFSIDDIRKSSTDGFDEIMIDLTKNRISQELTISSTLRTRAGILISFAGVVLVLLLARGGFWAKITNIVIDNAKGSILQNQPFVFFAIPFIMDLVGTTFFLISIVYGFGVILPRKWPAMTNLRELNNMWCRTKIGESKHAIKCALLLDLQNLSLKNTELAGLLRISFWLFIIGLCTMILIFFFDPSSISMKYLVNLFH